MSIVIDGQALAFYRTRLSQLAQGSLDPERLQRTEILGFVAIANNLHRRKLTTMAELHRRDRVGQARRKQRQYIGSFDARFAAAWAKTKVRGTNVLSRRFSQAYRTANRLGFGANRGEWRVQRRRKAGGGFRITGSFRGCDNAQQKLLANAISPFFGDHSCQFGRRGKDRAAETLRTHVEEAGFGHMFVHGDVRQFYDVIAQDWVRNNVPLPNSLKGWLFASGYGVAPIANRCQALRITEEEIERMAQRGLPQGSVLSPSIAEFVIRRMIDEVGHLSHYPFVNYSDNFGFILPEAKVSHLVATLEEGFRSHPAGPFDIRFTARPIEEECRFAGYSFRRGNDGHCHFWVREDDWLSRFAFWSEKLELGPQSKVERNIAGMRSYLSAWPLWPDRIRISQMWERQAVRILDVRGLSNLVPSFFGRENVSAARDSRQASVCLGTSL